jgi:hypothetical protein
LFELFEIRFNISVEILVKLANIAIVVIGRPFSENAQVRLETAALPADWQ